VGSFKHVNEAQDFTKLGGFSPPERVSGSQEGLVPKDFLMIPKVFIYTVS
jgi:hypothetical protein